jgi:hypothetical protein
MDIKLLHTEGCPNLEPAYELLLSCLAELKLDLPITRIVVRSAEEAERYHFLGSPSIQIDSKDIETTEVERPNVFGCRLYVAEGRFSGVPERRLIMKCLLSARESGLGDKG